MRRRKINSTIFISQEAGWQGVKGRPEPFRFFGFAMKITFAFTFLEKG